MTVVLYKFVITLHIYISVCPTVVGVNGLRFGSCCIVIIRCTLKIAVVRCGAM
jgi:hypothetical protein